MGERERACRACASEDIAGQVVDHEIRTGDREGDEGEPVEGVAQEACVKSRVRNLRERDVRALDGDVRGASIGTAVTRDRERVHLGAVGTDRERAVDRDLPDAVREPCGGRTGRRPRQVAGLTVRYRARRGGNHTVGVLGGVRRIGRVGRIDRLRVDVLYGVRYRSLVDRSDRSRVHVVVDVVIVVRVDDVNRLTTTLLLLLLLLLLTRLLVHRLRLRTRLRIGRRVRGARRAERVRLAVARLRVARRRVRALRICYTLVIHIIVVIVGGEIFVIDIVAVGREILVVDVIAIGRKVFVVSVGTVRSEVLIVGVGTVRSEVLIVGI